MVPVQKWLSCLVNGVISAAGELSVVNVTK